MRQPYVTLVPDLRSSVEMRPGISLYRENRFKEALTYFENQLRAKRIPNAVFYGLMGLASAGLGVPFLGFAVKDTMDPLYRALGHSCFQLGEDEQAARYFMRVYGKTAADLAVMSISLRAIGRISLAESVASMALKKGPKMEGFFNKTS